MVVNGHGVLLGSRPVHHLQDGLHGGFVQQAGLQRSERKQEQEREGVGEGEGHGHGRGPRGFLEEAGCSCTYHGGWVGFA